MFRNTYLIDDDPNTLYLHRYFLNAFSFFENLLEFQNANEAIDELVRDISGDKNLILLDLNMPAMSGWEFVDKVSAILSPTQIETTTIVIVSSSCNPRDMTRAEAHPYIYSFIEKPFLIKDIEDLIENLEITLIEKQVA